MNLKATPTHIPVHLASWPDQPVGEGAAETCGLIHHPSLPGTFTNHSVLMQKNSSGSGSNDLKTEVCVIPYTTLSTKGRA